VLRKKHPANIEHTANKVIAVCCEEKLTTNSNTRQLEYLCHVRPVRHTAKGKPRNGRRQPITQIMKLQIKKKLLSALEWAHGKHSFGRVPWISAQGKRGRPNTYPLALVPTTQIEDPIVVHD